MRPTGTGCAHDWHWQQELDAFTVVSLPRGEWMNQPTSVFSASESRRAEDVTPGEAELMLRPESQASYKNIPQHTPSLQLQWNWSSQTWIHIKNHQRRFIITQSLHSSGSQSGVPQSTSSGPPGTFLEVQIPGPHSGPTESDTLGVGAHQTVV